MHQKSVNSSRENGKDPFSLGKLFIFVEIGIVMAIALLAFNYWQAMDCQGNNPDAIEMHVDSLSKRLEASEAMLKDNINTLTRLQRDMEVDLTSLGKSLRDEIHQESTKEAVALALRQNTYRSPPKPDAFEEKHGLISAKVRDRGSEILFGQEVPEMENTWEFDDDDYIIARDEPAFTDPDTFGGKKPAARLGNDNGNDPFDDPGGAADAGEVFRDNLSDADARGLCSSWRETHNVVIGVSWGSLPFELQQKWLQYACDFLLQ